MRGRPSGTRQPGSVHTSRRAVCAKCAAVGGCQESTDWQRSVHPATREDYDCVTKNSKALVLCQTVSKARFKSPLRISPHILGARMRRGDFGAGGDDWTVSHRNGRPKALSISTTLWTTPVANLGGIAAPETQRLLASSEVAPHAARAEVGFRSSQRAPASPAACAPLRDGCRHRGLLCRCARIGCTRFAPLLSRSGTRVGRVPDALPRRRFTRRIGSFCFPARVKGCGPYRTPASIAAKVSMREFPGDAPGYEPRMPEAAFLGARETGSVGRSGAMGAG